MPNIDKEATAIITRSGDRVSYQQVFERIGKQKHERKIIKQSLQADLENSEAWCKLREELVALKAKIKQVEDTVLAPRAADVEQVQTITQSIKDDMEILSDLVLQVYANGETVEIKMEGSDGEEITFEPVFKVRFKQMSLF